MNIISLIQPHELGPDFYLDQGVWKVNFPTTATLPPPISNDARNIIQNFGDGMYVDQYDCLAYAMVQDNQTQKIQLWQFPADIEFSTDTATMVSEIDMLAMNGQFDDVAIDEGVITFTDAQTGLTLTLNTSELQRVGSIKSTDTVTVTETAGVLKLSAKIDPKANNLLEVTASGLQVSPDKIQDIFNAEMATRDVHTQSILPDEEIGLKHIIGDQIINIPKVMLVNSAGGGIALVNDPNSLVNSSVNSFSGIYRELTFKMTDGYFSIGDVDWYDPITGAEDPDTTLVINWGDGSPVETLVGYDIYNAYHKYEPGQECIATFMFDRMIPMFSPYGTAIKEVISFGITPILNPRFEACENLVQVPASLPSYVTSLERTFERCGLFNGSNISLWDVSNVTNLERTFYGAASFNQPLNNWDVSNVTNMTTMFYQASEFNQDLSQWCVSNILSIPSLFNYGAPLLTGNLLPVWGTCPSGENTV